MNNKRELSLKPFLFLALLGVLVATGSRALFDDDDQARALETHAAVPTWTHLSSTTGDIDAPSGSEQQTSALVLDVDKDGLNDLLIGARRSPGPSMVWYKRLANGWQRYVIDETVLNIEAGGAYHDIDNDGDLDVVMGGDSGSNEVWWWENPYPAYDPATEWTRRTIKNSGGNQHHDQIFGDFDNDGAAELVFWNQKANQLLLAEIPSNPRSAGAWSLRTIYSWSSGDAHEGLAQADIDADGLVDIVGGGRWFKFNPSDSSFTANIIDEAQTFGRVAAGQLIARGRAEVVFSSGDGVGPLKWYRWNGSSWVGTNLLTADVDHGHSLQLEDVNNDGYLDIFAAEMRLNGGNSDAKMWLFLGDGAGSFTTSEVASGYGNHESKLADLDGDGDFDILGKPYNWETPRLDIWLNNSVCMPALDQWERHVVDSARPERAIFVYPGDIDGDGLEDIVSGAWWYKNPGLPSGSWQRKTIGSPLNNAAAVYDFDKDGDLDILGTEGVGSAGNDDFVWARNNGSGVFTIYDNIEAADGDFLQGVAVDQFVAGNTEVALSWHRAGKGVQMLDVAGDPLSGTWSWSQISATSQDEGLSSGDIDRDGDRDLLLGTKWLRNDAPAGAGSDWADNTRAYRAAVTVDMNGYARKDAVSELAINFTTLLASSGAVDAFDEASIRVVEVDGSNSILDNNVPFQFDADTDFDAGTNAAGTLIFLLVGDSTANEARTYHVYFDLLDGQPATPVSVTPQVLLTDDVTDEGLASYQIETNSATYFYQKQAGGFSSLVDSAGNDWINHNSSAGSAGDFRGIPNLVHPNDGGYFHPGRSGVVSSVLAQGALKATIHSRTTDNSWEVLWEIFPDHARMTVLKAATNYWFLYEGTPGGTLDLGSDFMVRSDGTQTLVDEAWTGDIDAPEWIFFGDGTASRSLYFVKHDDDALVDSYYEKDQLMTVFGFGRDGNTRALTQTPSQFTLGFSEQTGAAAVEPTIDSAYQQLVTALGALEEQSGGGSSGPWSVHTLFTGSGDPDRNRLVDMNKDGRLDAVVGYEAISTAGKLAWYKQPASATNLWTEIVIANDVIGPMSLDVADMDGDGDMDVVVGEHDTSSGGAPRMLVYENPGSETGSWIAHTVYTGDEHHDGAQLVDIDNDGDLDIISIGWTHSNVLLYENTGCQAGSPPPTATPGGPPPTATATAPPPTAIPSGDGPILYLSSTSGGSAGGVGFNDEDILAYDTELNSWSLFFDGSDVGLDGSSSSDIDAFHLREDNTLLFSIVGPSTLPDVGSVDDSDIILFTPTSTGEETAGSFSLYFDGSDVGLDEGGENIDALTLLDNGDLVISVTGSWSAGGLSGLDEDLLRFDPASTGANTSGSWSLFFDGSDVSLNTNYHEDIVALWSEPDESALYLSTLGPFSVTGANGDEADILRCRPGSLGSSTACAFNLYWDGSNNGYAGEKIDGLSIRAAGSGGSSPTATATATPDGPTATATATATGTPTATATATATATPDGPTATATNTPVPSGDAPLLYLSSSSGGSAGGVGFNDEDILAYDTELDSWSLFFDGSDVGLDGSSSSDIDAFHLREDSTLLFSIVGPSTLPDVGSVDDSDIILFTPTSTGEQTAGSFSLYFDGSDVGLDEGGENIDALTLLDNGDLVISVTGSWSAGGLSGLDEDLLRFDPASTGANTSGSWSLFFDGSDVDLNTSYHEDIVALWSEPDASALYLSTLGPFSVTGANGDESDILRCRPGSLGSSTACAFDLYWDGSNSGYAGEKIDGLSIRAAGSGGSSPTATATATPDGPTATATATATGTPTATATATATATPDGPTATATNTPVPSGDTPLLYLSSSSGGSAGGVGFNDEDIVVYDTDSGSWSMFLDFSDTGAGGIDINAFHLLDDNTLLFSLQDPASLPDTGAVDDSDIIRFAPTSTGEDTVGTFSLFFDGSDVGLDESGENIDALTVLDNGDLVISMTSSWSAGGLSGLDEDLLRFDPASTGSNTAGSWSLFFDGSDVSLNTTFEEDIGGLWSEPDASALYMSTFGSFSVSGAAGDESDILRCRPDSLGSSTACAFDLYWDGSNSGFAGEKIDGLSIRAADTGGPLPTATATATGTATSTATATAVGPTATATATAEGPTATSTATPTATATATSTPTSAGSGSGRVTQDLVALYTFEEGQGASVSDVSNVGAPLNLAISGNTSWLSEGGLRINGSSSLSSSAAASKITAAAKSSAALSVEVWVKPANVIQDGPARIVSISADANNRNITLGQGLWGSSPSNLFDVRLRTANTDDNGQPSLTTDSGSATTQLQHLVFTYENGQRRIYKNGTLIANAALSGNLDNWDAGYPLLLANETTGDRPWLGDLHLVAFYSRALSAGEVVDNFEAGTHPDSGGSPPTATPDGPTPTATATPIPGGGGGDKEMIVYDWNGLVAQSENGFPRNDPPTANGDWTQPVNFAEGTLHFRVQIRSQPVPQEMRLQYCVWQDRNALENCADWIAVSGNPGTEITWSDTVTGMWMLNNNPIDWTRARYKDGVAIKNSSGQAVSTFQGWDWNGEDPQEWYPIDWRFLVVVVAKGETFSGWSNYN